MWCPYCCYWENTLNAFVKHFEEAHPNTVIKDNCYPILKQSRIPQKSFFLNEWRGDFFLSKCQVVTPQALIFCTTCLTRKNPVEYQLIFVPKGTQNPTVTRMLQTTHLGDALGTKDEFLNLARIYRSLGFPEEFECRFSFNAE